MFYFQLMTRGGGVKTPKTPPGYASVKDTWPKWTNDFKLIGMIAPAEWTNESNISYSSLFRLT